MREDHLEALDKLFPKGFIIMKVDEDDSVRLSYYNKSQNELLYSYFSALMHFVKEANEANGEIPPSL